MRERSPGPAASRYATASLTPSTSRNSRLSAPGTTPLRQVSPPSMVTAYVPPTPLVQTIRLLTGLMAWRRLVVPLRCGVRVGTLSGEVSPARAADALCAPEQPAPANARRRQRR